MIAVAIVKAASFIALAAIAVAFVAQGRFLVPLCVIVYLTLEGSTVAITAKRVRS